MIECTFPVTIYPSGDTETVISVSKKDYKAMLRYRDEEDFCDCKALSKLYEKVYNAVLDELAEGTADDQSFITENLDDNYDYNKARTYLKDHYDIAVEYPDDLDEERLEE